MSKLTSTQQQPAALLLAGQGDACYPVSHSSKGKAEGTKAGGAGAFIASASAPRLVNGIKLAIVAVMLELDRPVTASELQVFLKEPEELSIFEYHLNTLVEAGVAERVVDPDELRFRLSRGSPERTQIDNLQSIKILIGLYMDRPIF